MSTPTQYRRLKKGEIVQKGDDAKVKGGAWTYCNTTIGWVVGSTLAKGFSFRRPIPQPAPEGPETGLPERLAIDPANVVQVFQPGRPFSTLLKCEMPYGLLTAKALAAELVNRYNQHDSLCATVKALADALAGMLHLDQRTMSENHSSHGPSGRDFVEAAEAALATARQLGILNE